MWRFALPRPLGTAAVSVLDMYFGTIQSPTTRQQIQRCARYGSEHVVPASVFFPRSPILLIGKHDSENPFSSYRKNVRQSLKGPEEKLRGRGLLSPESAGQMVGLLAVAEARYS
jgi:hypothetical protein